MESLASSMESRERKIKRLEAKFSAVEDEIFGQFCAQVGLQDIRYVHTCGSCDITSAIL